MIRSPSRPARLLIHAAVYALALSMALPFLWMISTSLKSEAETLSGRVSLLPQSWRWSNFPAAVRAANLDRYYLNSFIVAALTTSLGVLHNALAGYAFAKLRFPGRRPLLVLALLTMTLPVQVSFIFMALICAHLGYLDNTTGLIVPFLASGFGIFYMKQVCAAVPDALLEAGRMDGMSDFDLFWLIVRPAAWPGIAALAIITFVNSWNAFFWPLVAVDSDRAKTLPLAIADLASGKFVQSWPVRMAAATILTLPLLIGFLIFQRAFVRGVTATGLKE